MLPMHTTFPFTNLNHTEMKKLFLLCALLLLIVSAFAQQTLYRYFNPKQGRHYYTTNFNEYGNGGQGWYLEGPQCIIFDHQDRGLAPLFHYYNERVADHYYIISFNELGRGSKGYVLEGKIGFISPNPGPRLVPLFAYFNRVNGDHFLTTDRSELAQGFDGYEYTGTLGYVLPVGGNARPARDRGRDFYRNHH